MNEQRQRCIPMHTNVRLAWLDRKLPAKAIYSTRFIVHGKDSERRRMTQVHFQTIFGDAADIALILQRMHRFSSVTGAIEVSSKKCWLTFFFKYIEDAF